ncbi:uncharacterized protein LOC132187821 [Corylus avellana]|uniref:uncharacterized protein LOC132187821 n=1 Tax=Corylus avellana TaxID=13451 RepID=UPI00286A8666|nr:uncharacterized protein LOC132187821 [Corylus avellana]
MGNSLKNFAPGSEEKKAREIGPIIEKRVDTYFSEYTTKEFDFADFYRAVCETVEEINKKIGSTQFRIPTASTLQKAYNTHHKGKDNPLTKDEFETILREVIIGTGVTGIGAKDTLLYIFGVPVTALFIKQQIMPRVIPNEIFIPGVTSATVFVLAKLNKI